MPVTTELLPKPTQHESTKNPEVQFQVYDGAGEVRKRILHAPQWQRGELILPRGTVSVSAEAGDLNDQFVLAASEKVGRLLEGGILGLEAKDIGSVRQTGAFTSLSSLDRLSRARLSRNRKPGEPDPSITLLYDAELPPNKDFAVMPSAIMIHGDLPPEQLASVRERFGTTPLIDKHNELLDSIGAEERARARETYERDVHLGEAAVEKNMNKTRTHSVMRADIASTIANASTAFSDKVRIKEGHTRPYESSVYPAPATAGTDLAIAETASHEEKQSPKTPGSMNERVDQAIKDVTGGREWTDLSEQEQRRAGRKLAKQYHTDTGGDQAFAKKILSVVREKPLTPPKKENEE